MRRLFVIIGLAAFGAMAVVTLASASRTGGRVTPAAERAYPWLPAGVKPAGAEWPAINGDMANARFSTLKQLNTGNVGNLKLAWQVTYDKLANGTNYNQSIQTFSNRPTVIIGAGKNLPLATGTMFLGDVDGMHALDPTTGKELWRYVGPPGDTTQAAAVPGTLKAPRGQSYFGGKVYVGQQDGSIVALNAKTGAAVWTVNVAAAGRYGSSTRNQSDDWTQVYDDGGQGVVITGANGGESPMRGHVDAYNATTGRLIWRTYNMPDPTDPAIYTWANPAEAATGGSSVWAAASIDPELGLVYYGTGNPYPYTGRQPGKNLWTDSVMAVSLKTGALKWYFQQVHHDEWDYDVANPPNRFNAVIDGKRVPVVATGGKTGYMYVLNAKTGKEVPHFPIPEVKVPDLNGGKGAALNNTWPTQPEPQGGAGDIVPMCYTAELAKLHYPTYPLGPNGKPIIPTCPFAPSYNDAYLLWGGGTSGGAIGMPPTSYDPDTNSLYVCALVQSRGTQNVSATDPTQMVIQAATTSGSGQMAPGGDSAVLAKLNMGTNVIDWKIHYPAGPDGGCYSGVVTTAGGLVFTATRGDLRVSDPLNTLPFGTPFGGFIHAYDARTGKDLWKWQALDIIQAAPMTYMVKGKQYVGIVTQGHSDAKVRDMRLMVFSL